MSLSQYVDKIEHEKKLAAANALPKSPTVMVLSDGLMSGTKGFVADVIKTAGGENRSAQTLNCSCL